MSILCYHAVDPCWSSPLSVTPEAFDEHLALLARSRTVVPLDVAVEHLDARGRLPRGMVALTFDDGFQQLEEHVFPSLARHGLPATLFLVAATLTPEGQPVDWVDTPPPDRQLETLDVDAVLAARDQGIGIGSHTWSHPRLTELDEDDCLAEMTRSRELLGDLLHQRVDHLAYPRGLHDATARRSAERAGYTHSFTLPQTREDVGRHALPRVGIFPGNGSMAVRVKTQPSYVRARMSPVFPAVRSVARRIRS